MNLKIKRLKDSAIMPEFATPGSACFDLRCILPVGRKIYMNPGDSKVFSTGLAMSIPQGHVLAVFSRSGHGFKHDIRLANCTGIIDSDYRGEILIKLKSDALGGDVVQITHGDRIAQAMLIPIPQIEFMEVFELDETERGTGGIGSTGSI